MTRFPGAYAVCALLLLIGNACLVKSNQGPAKPEVTVAAAANLSDAFAEIASQFEAETGARVVLSFGSTAELAKQVEHGAPFDVFASADTQHIASLETKQVVEAGTRAVFARGALVLWIPAATRVRIATIGDLASSEPIRIAVARPELAPYGRASVEVLQRLGLWGRVESRVVYGENVNQVRQYASTGNVDAAFIPLALAGGADGRVIEIDESLHSPIEQEIAVIRSSEHLAEAKQFAAFVLSSKGQTILRRYGYKPPPDQAK